jgi:A/G-specific adenine glycosylase
MSSKADWNFFRRELLNWYRADSRPMPWKEEPDPYLIWLSEIILQQTRVAQGMAYFERFKAAYPQVENLASAPDDDVMKLWEGLGYYSRARNLLKAARMIVRDYGGKFPDTHAGLLSLPGVGPYTAAAIGSFGFGLPLPVLDGNVYRILSRYAADATPIDTTPGKKRFMELADLAFAPDRPALYNQAIMDFGALVCTPKRASCGTCPLVTDCKAKATGQVYELPVKAKKMKRRTRYFHYLVLTNTEGDAYIHKRTKKDIWQELYQFPLVETIESDLNVSGLVLAENWPSALPPSKLKLGRSSPPTKHVLSHQDIIGTFHEFTITGPFSLPDDWLRVSREKLSEYAFPKLITRYLDEKP